MSQTITYRAGAELPGLTLPWQYETASGWADLDLSSGYTFQLLLIGEDGTTALTKSTNVTGTNSGCTIAWATGELALTAGTYRLHLRATETATSKDRDYRPSDPIRIVIVD